MTTLKLLCETHNFNHGDKVKVYKRMNPDSSYDGVIYSIQNKPMQLHLKIGNPCVDYFYVKFDKDVYSSLLTRGWNIIYQRRESILGNVEKNDRGEITRIFIQPDFIQQYESVHNETEIDFDKIDAILIWRVAFRIE